MSYTLDTDVTESATKRALYECFDKWPGAELLSVGQTGSKAELVFEWHGDPVRISYGLQVNYRSNLRAIFLTLDSLRMTYKRGLGDILTGTISQMLKLGEGARQRDPYEVLGIRPDTPIEVAEAAWKALSRTHHPDANGSEAGQIELNAAIEKVRVDKAATP